MYPLIFRKVTYVALLALLQGAAGAVQADGVIRISQTKTLNGNVTPSDEPGFPVSLNEPGSYRLSGNLMVPDADTTAIEINADDVTLNLNGFRIAGPTVCSGVPVVCSPSGRGMGIDAFDPSNITVVDGTVRGMGDDGISAREGARIQNVHVTSNGGTGIVASGTVSGNTANNNGGAGIFVFTGTVSGNTATNNGGDGIEADGGATVSNNTANNNGERGIIAKGGTVTGNTANSNRSDGIVAAGTSTSIATGTVSGNTANTNGGRGIVASDSIVTNNTAFGNSDVGLFLTNINGYALNNVNFNNGGKIRQVSGGIDLGHNVCAGDTSCP